MISKGSASLCFSLWRWCSVPKGYRKSTGTACISFPFWNLWFRLFLLGKRCQVEGTEAQIPTPKRALWCPPHPPYCLRPCALLVVHLISKENKFFFFFCEQSGLGLLVRGLVSLMELRGGTGSRMEGISPW